MAYYSSCATSTVRRAQGEGQWMSEAIPSDKGPTEKAHLLVLNNEDILRRSRGSNPT